MNRSSLDTRRLSHAYIVSSPSETRRLELARFLAKAMVCSGTGDRPCGICRDCRKADAGTHPDIIAVERLDAGGETKREIQVGQIRDIAADAAVVPNESACKVYLIADAHLMNRAAQNTILKVLEEPPAHAGFILCADRPDSLLPTVRSRCIELSGNDEAEADEAEAVQKADVYLKLIARGSRAELFAFCAANESMSIQQASAFMVSVSHALSDRLAFRAPDGGLSRADMCQLFEKIKRADRYLASNVSVKHVFGFLAVII